MPKNLSRISLLATSLFLTTTFASAPRQNEIQQFDNVGFPFSFLTVFNGGETLECESFSLLGFMGNCAVYLGIALLVLYVVSLLKVQRKKTSVA